MNIISHEIQNDNQTNTTISNFFKFFHLGKILKKCNFYKTKGVSCIDIFNFIFCLIFQQKNLYQYLDSNSTKKDFSKDVVYRFINNINFNWVKFILLLATNVIAYIKTLTSSDRDTVFIIDDSLYSKARSKSMELLAKVFDHSTHKFTKGFRMLTLAWSDGKSLIPVSFRLLSSKNEKNILCKENENIDKRTIGYSNRKDAVLDSITALVNMLTKANKMGIKAKYVLMDTWFAFPSTICKILKSISTNVICMVKSTPKMTFVFNGEKLNLKQIYSKTKKRRGRSKYISSVTVEIGINDQGEPILAKIVFVKKYNSDEWLALLSTNIDISEEQIIQIYGKRWDIEVFFKITKSYLGLSKEFQTRSYDSQIAHISIVFTRYIMLSYINRIQIDPKTLGALTFQLCDELNDITFIESFNLVISLLTSILKEEISISQDEITKLIDILMSKLPEYLKSKLIYIPISA